MPRFYSDTTLGTDLEGVMLRDAHTARQEAARAVAGPTRARNKTSRFRCATKPASASGRLG
jgi:hypothetical protein